MALVKVCSKTKLVEASDDDELLAGLLSNIKGRFGKGNVSGDCLSILLVALNSDDKSSPEKMDDGTRPPSWNGWDHNC